MFLTAIAKKRAIPFKTFSISLYFYLTSKCVQFQNYKSTIKCWGKWKEVENPTIWSSALALVTGHNLSKRTSYMIGSTQSLSFAKPSLDKQILIFHVEV